MIDQAAPRLAVQDLHVMATMARAKLAHHRRGLRLMHVRALVQRVEIVSKHEIRVMGSQNALLKALTAMDGGQAAELGSLNPAGRTTSAMDDAYVMTAPLCSLCIRAVSRGRCP